MEPVTAYHPGGVKIATSNVGAMNLIGAKGSSACAARAPSYTAPAFVTDVTSLCLTVPTTVTPDAQSRATQFVFGRGSSIRGSDGNTAVTAFAAIPIN